MFGPAGNLALYQGGHDPFIARNIKFERRDTLQVFNLLLYGQPLIRCIIDQIQKDDRELYWYILREVLYALPAPLALKAINDPNTKDTLKRIAKPDQLGEVARRLLDGASFPPSSALALAKFFDGLAKKDLIQEAEWKDWSKKFEVTAYDEIIKVESNNLVYVLLNIPLTQYSGQSLFHLALEQKRVSFLNNDRINSLILYQYQKRFLKPEQEIRNERNLRGGDLLHMVLVNPFEFYFTAQGYQWVSVVLHVFYFLFILFYVSFRPVAGSDSDFGQKAGAELDVLLWTMNMGYILYEFQECFVEKGPAEYFNFGVQGDTNLLDVTISIFWIVLFSIRLHFLEDFRRSNFDEDTQTLLLATEQPFFSIETQDTDTDGGQSVTAVQQLYVFLFGLQILFLSMRTIILFRDTSYFGKLIRVIILMMWEILKFIGLFALMMMGFVFGIWLISVYSACSDGDGAFVGDSDEDCGDFEINSIFDTTRYVFQVFIGTGDLSGVGDLGIGIAFMVIATLLGTLILTNLLIALMTTRYEEVEETARDEVVYSRAQASYDYAQRGRLMPPPLNVVVLAFMLVIDVLNFIPALIKPNQWNIYAYVDYTFFRNLQKSNIWSFIFCCCCKNTQQHHATKSDSQQRTNDRYVYNDAGDVLEYYFLSWHYDWNVTDRVRRFFMSCCNDRGVCAKCACCLKSDGTQQTKARSKGTYRRVHHHGCYGSLILSSGGRTHRHDTIKGLTMAQYFAQYEAVNQTRIELKDTQLLKRLTTDTLFCEYCYRPVSKKNVLDQLTTPYIALLDYISAITFVVIPVAWIPLVVIFSIWAAKDWIASCFQAGGDDHNEEYNHADFDNEYVPQTVMI